jgi:Protein of unknown function (DUF3808)
LYYCITGSAHLVLDRRHVQTGNDLAAGHTKKATELFRKAPARAGKKRFTVRQLPFDSFVTRKVEKWETRARGLNVDLVDAVGVDPLIFLCQSWYTLHNQGKYAEAEVMASAELQRFVMHRALADNR